jgi:hypothetical protein
MSRKGKELKFDQTQFFCLSNQFVKNEGKVVQGLQGD